MLLIDTLKMVLDYCHAAEIQAAALLCKNSAEQQLGDAGEAWFKRKCLSLWGEACLRRDPNNGTWRAFYLLRATHRPTALITLSQRENAPETINLIQKSHCGNAWELLTSGILCSRTSGGSTIHSVIGRFFSSYPTPTHVLSASEQDLRELLLPLGLNRERTLRRFSREFLAPWARVSDLHGCGKFAGDSHAIFCLDRWEKALKDPQLDRNLLAHCRIIRKLWGERETKMKKKQKLPAAVSERNRRARKRQKERSAVAHMSAKKFKVSPRPVRHCVKARGGDLR
ncbi:unnamed protein product [Chrysoparadoxa australica]